MEMKETNGGIDPEELSRRIAALRETRGLSERELGARAGVGDFVRQLRIGHVKEPSVVKLVKVARSLGCSLDDLLQLSHAPPADNVAQLSEHRAMREGYEGANIDEIDVKPGATGANPRSKVIGTWVLPSVLLRHQTSARADELKVMTVYGDFMAPEFSPGDRILVDTDARSPSPPGVFVLYDGFALTLARVQLVPNATPATVRIIPRNDQYETYERPLDQVEIYARVTGKWLWT